MTRPRSRRGCHGTRGGHAGGVAADDAIAVRPLGPDDARDARLAGEVAALINGVYAASETGIWREKPLRP